MLLQFQRGQHGSQQQLISSVSPLSSPPSQSRPHSCGPQKSSARTRQVTDRQYNAT